MFSAEHSHKVTAGKIPALRWNFQSLNELLGSEGVREKDWQS